MFGIHRSEASLFGTAGLAFAVVLCAAPAATLADKGADHRLTQPRPSPLGVSGSGIEFLNIDGDSYCYTGTFGALVTDGSKQYLLSNNHVLAYENGTLLTGGDPKGVTAIQTGLLDENGSDNSCSPAGTDYTPLAVGTVTDWVEIAFDPNPFDNIDGPANLVDAAIASVLPNKIDAQGRILDIGGIADTTVFDGLGSLGDLVGTPVMKSGRTTGLTTGDVVAVGANITVQYDGGKAYFVDQILINGNKGKFLNSGDSGSLAVTNLKGQDMPQAVGLLFAGSLTGTAIANRIDDVLSELGVTMVGCTINCGRNDLGGGSEGGGGNGGGPPAHAGGPNGGRNARAGLEQAAAARGLHETALKAVPGVVGTGLGYGPDGTPEIQVYTAHSQRSVRAPIPATLDGVRVRVIETGEFRAY